jgi:hypothetical protein
MGFDGRWKISIPTPLGEQQVLLDIDHKEGRLGGTATQGGEVVPFLEPSVDGDRIAWSQRITKPMKMQIRFDLVRDGDLLSGKAKPGFFPAIGITGARVS